MRPVRPEPQHLADAEVEDVDAIAAHLTGREQVHRDVGCAPRRDRGRAHCRTDGVGHDPVRLERVRPGCSSTCWRTARRSWESCRCPPAVARVVTPGATWQYGFIGLYAIPPCEDAPAETCSGSLARTSQESITCCPVLVPALHLQAVPQPRADVDVHAVVDHARHSRRRANTSGSCRSARTCRE